MKHNFVKRILSLIMVASVFMQMTYAIVVNAEEYLNLDFEAATDTSGWTSEFASSDMSLATDEKTEINKYFSFVNSSGSGTRNAYYTFPADAQKTEDNKTVVEFDFNMKNTGNENINQIVMLDSAISKPKGNANYSGEYIFSLTQPKNSDSLIINSLDGSDSAYATTDWTNNSGWTHLKAILDFSEHSTTLILSSLNGEKIYFENKVPMGTNGIQIGKLAIIEPRKNTSQCGIDNIVVRSYDSATDAGSVYYDVTYDVKGVVSSESVKGTASPINFPDTTNYGYIFKGWAVNDNTEQLITTDELKVYEITANTKFTAVYEQDTSYIEPIVSAVIEGENMMTFGDSPDSAAENKYTLTITGQAGTIITADTVDSRVEDFNIEWDIDGFKTVNDTDKYCDSYGEFAEHTSTATDVSFMLKQADFNFYGKLKATITYNGTTTEASMYVVALGDKSMESGRVFPEAGYPIDFDEYPDSLVGYQTFKDTMGGDDIIVGGWGMSGSDSGGNAAIMKEDNNKFIRLSCPTSSKSHMFTNYIDTPQKQIIFEQKVRFNGNGCITLTSKQPFWSSSYTIPVKLEFNGTTILLNSLPIKKNDVDVTVNSGKWYKIVLSVDKTTQTCFVKVFDTDEKLVGETENVAWKEPSEPTYYSIGYDNKVTGTIDFDAYKAYYPEADASTYTLTASQETLSIPNKDTATLAASVKSAEGYDITGEATWTVLEEDMQAVIITPDTLDSHKATVTLAEGASAGEATVQVNIGGFVKTIKLNITDSAESIKFTSSQSSVAIPLDESAISVAKYTAAVINGEGTDLCRDVTLEVYDKNNVKAYTLPEGITFDAQTGIVEVTSKAVPCVFSIRATGESTDGETLSRSVKVTVHGLSFDFGNGDDESVAEGYTDVNSLTTYTDARGYGIEGGATSAGIPSIDDAKSDYLSGDFTFKAKVTRGKVYKVRVAFSGDLVSEYVSDALSGHERTLAEEATSHTGYTVKTTEITEQTYEIPVVDDVLDLKFSGASVAYIIIEKIEKTPNEKPHIYSVGDSTIGNNGSYAYNLARDQVNYPELTNLVTYHNNGKGSRNLKTYYTQGWLDNILINIRPGDIVTVGNMGTNPGGMSGSQFKAPLDYYVDACIAMGAKIILTSYTPHGCVAGYEYVYNAETHTFHGCREDAYDSLGIRVIYEERKNDPEILGFIDIGKNADNAFNEYVADFADNGYADENAAAQAIIECFGDHNHYGNQGRSQLAGNLMLNGYGTTPGIVSELVRVITEAGNKPCVRIEVQYDDDGKLVNVTVTDAKISEAKETVRTKNSLVTYWYSLDNMRPVNK